MEWLSALDMHVLPIIHLACVAGGDDRRRAAPRSTAAMRFAHPAERSSSSTTISRALAHQYPAHVS